MTGGDVLTGGCLCGAVRFEVDRPLRDIVVCHCSLCRRSSTSAAAYTSVRRAGLRLAASDGLATYVDVNGRERAFCSVCGASLFWAAPGTNWISVSAGALDGATGLRVMRHIYARSAADWETFPHDLPVHGEGSSSPLVSRTDESEGGTEQAR